MRSLRFSEDRHFIDYGAYITKYNKPSGHQQWRTLQRVMRYCSSWEKARNLMKIIYEHRRFHIRDTRFAFYPVVRVTWYGAMAYSNHYRKRLPASEELREALLYLRKNTGTLKKENTDLQIRTGEIREWAIGKGTQRNAGPGLRSSQEKFPYQSVIIFKQPSLEKAPVEERFPWEGFTDVGFRCIRDPTSENK